jgi:tetratricopeptide (TPR) repeat protein
MLPELDTHLDQLFYSASLAYDQNRFAATAELLSPYLRHRPGHGYAWFLYGDALRAMGLVHEAERALVRAQDLCPKQPWPRVRLGMIKEQLGHRESAEVDFAAAAKSAEVARAGWFWVIRGTNLAAMGQFQQAEACHRKALRCKDADAGEAYLNLGYVLRAQGRYMEAVDAFEACLRAAPGNADAGEAIDTLAGVREAARLAAATPRV